LSYNFPCFQKAFLETLSNFLIIGYCQELEINQQMKQFHRIFEQTREEESNPAMKQIYSYCTMYNICEPS
jgi:hypothetical protein